MKLLLSLILIITFSNQLINSININNNNNNINVQDEKINCAEEITKVSGFSTSFNSVSYSYNLDVSSFYESGYLSVDYKNERYMIEFSLQEDGQALTGKTWSFLKNHTQYILADNQNGVQCVKVPLMTKIPALSNFKNTGEKLLGKIETQVLQPPPEAVSGLAELLVDSKYCSPLALQIENDSPNGFTIVNFYSFEDTVKSFDYDIPRECITNSNDLSDILNSNNNNNILKAYPRFLKSLSKLNQNN